MQLLYVKGVRKGDRHDYEGEPQPARAAHEGLVHELVEGLIEGSVAELGEGRDRTLRKEEGERR